MATSSRPHVLPDKRVLLGPGPSEVPDRVLQAMSHPVIGHLDPQFLTLLDHVQLGLREVFQTENALTLAVPGTGTSGMEACLTNLVSPGDRVLVGVAGYFGARIAEIAERVGAEVHRLEVPWGEAVPLDRVKAAIERARPSVVALVHAETSTGVLQPVEEIFAAARQAGALTLLDCVTSLGGVPVEIDRWQVDAAYSCTQKCLGCPPGLAPVTLSARAVEKIKQRAGKPSSFYLDLLLLSEYWNGAHAYHHTAPCSLLYALAEGLAVIREEGLKARFTRHLRNHEALVAGLEAYELSLFTPIALRLPTLHAVQVPPGVDEAALRRELLNAHGIEIGAGLGPLRGKIWRVGLMGASSTSRHVLQLLAGLEQALPQVGAGPRTGGTNAALKSYRAAGATA